MVAWQRPVEKIKFSLTRNYVEGSTGQQNILPRIEKLARGPASDKLWASAEGGGEARAEWP